jgi:hypothetical protein
MSNESTQTLSHESQAAVNSLATIWRNAGRHPPSAVSTSSGADCDMPDCPAMTFVELKTSEGPRRLCFKHFQWVDQEQRSSDQP